MTENTDPSPEDVAKPVDFAKWHKGTGFHEFSSEVSAALRNLRLAYSDEENFPNYSQSAARMPLNEVLLGYKSKIAQAGNAIRRYKWLCPRTIDALVEKCPSLKAGPLYAALGIHSDQAEKDAFAEGDPRATYYSLIAAYIASYLTSTIHDYDSDIDMECMTDKIKSYLSSDNGKACLAGIPEGYSLTDIDVYTQHDFRGIPGAICAVAIEMTNPDAIRPKPRTISRIISDQLIRNAMRPVFAGTQAINRNCRWFDQQGCLLEQYLLDNPVETSVAVKWVDELREATEAASAISEEFNKATEATRQFSVIHAEIMRLTNAAINEGLQDALIEVVDDLAHELADASTHLSKYVENLKALDKEIEALNNEPPITPET